MSSASEQLQSKLSNQENEKKRNRIFLGEICGSTHYMDRDSSNIRQPAI